LQQRWLLTARAWLLNYSSDRKGAERVAQPIIDGGGKAVAIGVDVSQGAVVARLFKEVDAGFARLDVLVNNAGVSRFAPSRTSAKIVFHFHYNINALGSILTIQEAIKRFAEGGSIINLSSIVGSHPAAGALLASPVIGRVAFIAVDYC